tara:strand:+ start:627 stop:1535 length:909 start_codon:yes stop_codon:yes gene_type:complete
MNFISYSLFSPKKFYDHRTWDESNFNKQRYFFNIPSLCAVNKILYPEFSMHLSICPATENNPLFDFYKELCLLDKGFTYSVNEEEYTGHEPALWRMGLLWDSTAKTILSRDLDSIPNKQEYMSTRYFLDSDYLVHTIRSHENHFNYPCRMLIGLSGFKSDKIPKNILTNNFEEFKSKHGLRPELLADPTIKWNSDQLIVINAFTNDEFFTADNFLDSRINNQDHYPDFYCNSISESDLHDSCIDERQSKVLELVEKGSLTCWAGEPSDARGHFLSSVCGLEGTLPILKIIEGNSVLKEFYLG